MSWKTANRSFYYATAEDYRRVFAKLDHAPRDGELPEEALAGKKVKLLVKDDGDHYFQIARGHTFDLGRIVKSIRRRSGGEASEATDEANE